MDVMSQGHLLNGSPYEPHHLLKYQQYMTHLKTKQPTMIADKAGLYVDQTHSCREAPLTKQVPKVTLIYCMQLSFDSPSTGSCSSTNAVSLQSRSPLTSSTVPPPLPFSPAHPPQP